MSTIAAPEQDMLPLDFGRDIQILVPVYDVNARLADRQLCREYLKQWAGSFTREGAATAISETDFKAAAVRLASKA